MLYEARIAARDLGTLRVCSWRTRGGGLASGRDAVGGRANRIF